MNILIYGCWDEFERITNEQKSSSDASFFLPTSIEDCVRILKKNKIQKAFIKASDDEIVILHELRKQMKATEFHFTNLSAETNTKQKQNIPRET